MPCAGYCRVSLEEAVEQYGLASQLASIREYARAHKLDLPDELVLVDEGFQGADFDRPALSRLREMVRARLIDGIIVHDPDRLARKVAHFAIVIEECERYGVRLHFVTTPTDRSAESVMFLQLKGVFAEYERAKINERTLRGRREKARQGHIVGGKTPYGYDYRGKQQGERGRFTVNEAEATVVREVFEWAASGVSTREIAVRLNGKAIPSKTGGKWARSSVAKLLKNEMFIGQAYYNRRRRVAPENVDKARHDKKTCLKARPESEWIPIPVPAIIGHELFDAVSARLARNLEVFVGRPGGQFLLRGLLWCKCGRRYHGDPGRHGKRYYRCASRDRILKGCGAGTIPADRLESGIWNAVTGLFSDPRALRALIARHIEEIRAPRQDAAPDLRERIEQLRRREFRAAQAMLDAELSEQHQMFRTEMLTASRERRALEKQIREQSDQSALETTDVDALCREIRKTVWTLEGPDKHVFLTLLVDRVLYADGMARIHCAVPTGTGGRVLPLSSERCGQYQEASVISNPHSAETQTIPLILEVKIA